jgi:hypothetical protein
MGSTAATEIEDLWYLYFPTAEHSSSAAAALQIAIWEEVVAGVTSQNQMPSSDYFWISPSDPNAIAAAADIASLIGYNGPAADLVGLTGAGQDYVIDAPPTGNTLPIPDGGVTAALLCAALVGIEAVRRKFGCLVPQPIETCKRQVAVNALRLRPVLPWTFRPASRSSTRPGN